MESPAKPVVEHALRLARALAAEALPFFAPVLFNTRIVLVENLPHLAGIDEGMRVYFNPQGVADILAQKEQSEAIAQLAWLWSHEVSHAIRDHGSRCRERQSQPLRWNVCADLEINDASWPGLLPPRTLRPLFPETFGLPRGKTAEYYDSRLPVNTVSQEATPEEGSGVDGSPHWWELPPEDESCPAVPPLEQEAIRRRVAEGVRKTLGHGAGNWVRWAEGVLNPRIDWRIQLSRLVRRSIVAAVGGRLDYCYRRPHRRSYHYRPVIRPSLTGNLEVRLACVVDTSGSMSPADLARALAEVRGVLESLRCPIHVLPCDEVPREAIRLFTQSDTLRLLHDGMVGGGGTNMVAGIEAALELRPLPDMVLVLTDGFTPWPPRTYRTPVVFGILAEDHGQVPMPPMPPWKATDVAIIRTDD
jgi:predicted metal-dependent peptidase